MSQGIAFSVSSGGIFDFVYNGHQGSPQLVCGGFETMQSLKKVVTKCTFF